MAEKKAVHDRVTVTEIEEFLRNPPADFSVEALGSGGYIARCDPEQSLVLIDDFESSLGKIVFQKSLGRQVVMQNLWEYTSMRKSLLSKRILLHMSSCVEDSSETNKNKPDTRVLQQYVVSIDGSDPYIKWQMERGLDWTISSVAGESYRVDIDLREVLEGWGAKNIHIAEKVKPVWRDTCFTLKYYSDALFDFAHWFGFSKRKFSLRLTLASCG